MKAKVLGRLELLAWINHVAMSEYTSIDQLSDGVAFCHVVDAFYPNIELSRIKFNSNKIEDWERNFITLNDFFKQVKCPKTVDYQNLAKGKFNINFEFLQYVYDFILKNFPNEISNVKYHAYNRRIEALSSQNQKFNQDNIKKYLPSYLIPSENVINQEIDNKVFSEEDAEKDRLLKLLDKYKHFMTLLKDDLKKSIENNLVLSADILEIEEERNYYLEKLKVVYNFCNKKLEKVSNEDDKSNINEVLKILNHVPEDFK